MRCSGEGVCVWFGLVDLFIGFVRQREVVVGGLDVVSFVLQKCEIERL